jgi:putative methionine-R-sulfoxide reductase with GAF domain
LRTTFLTSAIGTILDEPVGKTGQASLFIPGEVIFHFHEGKLEQVEPEEYARLQAVADQGMFEMDYEGDASVVLQAPIQTLEGNLAVDNLGWMIVFHQHQNEAFAPVNIQIRGAVILISVIMLIAVVAAIGLSIFLVRPISELTQTAEEVAAGKLGSRAKVTSSDEVGILASTFNSMTSQLQEILQSLEQRVAARTKDLEIVAEVGTATATILESKRLLQEVVDLTKERFYLYHSHIYLLDEEGKNLVLAAGAGEPGRQMLARGLSIPLDRKQSLVARAARERKGVTVNDVTQAPDFLPNPLLPDTRSELAVPMIVGGKVIGVFDIQSEQVGRFTDADVNIQTTLAAQLATSIQNVRSFEQSRKQAELESMVNTIGQKIRKTASVEDTLQTAIREIGLALGASRVSASIGTSRQPDGDEVRRN